MPVPDTGPPDPQSSAARSGLVPDVAVQRIDLGDSGLADLGVDLGGEELLRLAVFPEEDDASSACEVWPVARDAGGEAPLLDQHGHARPAPVSTAAGERLPCLVAGQWNLLELRLPVTAAAGVEPRPLALRCPAGPGRLWFQLVGTIPAPTSADGCTPICAADPVEHVRTIRGSHSRRGWSRGNTFPAVALPHGAAFLTPITDARSRTWLYQWHPENRPDARPALQGLGIAHQPSPWINDRCGFHAMPWRGTPELDSSGRAITFSHDRERDRPHHYRVELDDGTVAEATPTLHGGMLRFTLPGSRPRGVLVDMPGNGLAETVALAGGRVGIRLRLDPAPGFGRPRRDPVGFAWLETRQPAVVVPHGGRRRQAVALELHDSGDVLELSMATSSISADQARHNHYLELAGRSFDAVLDDAHQAWAGLLGSLELPDATHQQRVEAWSNLARLHLWPSAAHENVGTTAEPRWVHASPFVAPRWRDGLRSLVGRGRWHSPTPVVDGEFFTNNGWWDTYRTCWPHYALFTPELAGRLVDGILPAWQEGGWMGRWSAPGHVDSMVGTSSDVIFADAAAHGLAFDEESAWRSALRNASCPSPSTFTGRKGIGPARFRGWVSSDVAESVGWGVENALCDAVLARWAERRGDHATAAWLAHRARQVELLHDPATGFLRGRNSSGERSTGFDPLAWGGDFTETDAWGMSVSMPADGAALARLHGNSQGHGGEEALAQHLDELFATPERADRPGHYRGVLHEMREARSLRLGQCGISNQPAHHIPFMYLAAGRPDRAQAVVADALDRLFVGSEIGQGYPGDEDNGEMSAWWLWCATGLYPLAPGSGEYVVNAPAAPWRCVPSARGRMWPGCASTASHGAG